MANYDYTSQYSSPSSSSSSQRGVAMVLALVTAVVLSPLYIDRSRNNDNRYYDTKWSSGFVLPVVLAGLIVAIRTTSSSSNSSSSSSSMGLQRSCGRDSDVCSSSSSSWVLRIGSSSWGLAGVLVMLMFVLSWQNSVQHFFWR